MRKTEFFGPGAELYLPELPPAEWSRTGRIFEEYQHNCGHLHSKLTLHNSATQGLAAIRVHHQSGQSGLIPRQTTEIFPCPGRGRRQNLLYGFLLDPTDIFLLGPLRKDALERLTGVDSGFVLFRLKQLDRRTELTSLYTIITGPDEAYASTIIDKLHQVLREAVEQAVALTNPLTYSNLYALLKEKMN